MDDPPLFPSGLNPSGPEQLRKETGPSQTLPAPPTGGAVPGTSEPIPPTPGSIVRVVSWLFRLDFYFSPQFSCNSHLINLNSSCLGNNYKWRFKLERNGRPCDPGNMTELQPRLPLDEDVASHFRTVHVTERSRRDDQLCDECHVSQAGADDRSACSIAGSYCGSGGLAALTAPKAAPDPRAKRQPETLRGGTRPLEARRPLTELSPRRPRGVSEGPGAWQTVGVRPPPEKKKKEEEASHSFSEFQLAVTIKQPCEGTRLCDFLADRTFVMKEPLPPANSVFSSELFPVPTCFVLTETVCKYLRIWLKKKK